MCKTVVRSALPFLFFFFFLGGGGYGIPAIVIVLTTCRLVLAEGRRMPDL